MTESLILLPTPRKMALQFGMRGGGGEVVESRSSTLPPQGYRLVITGERVEIVGGDAAGIFYGRQTLAQLRRQFGGGEKIPCGEIEDWPDFPVRGVMLDVSRDKVPTMATLFMLVDHFAELKINQLQLYTEHTFQFANHPDVWRDASPMTPEEIRELDNYCRARFIELVPNQNSFGHMARWLKHPRYADLAEAPDGFTFPWGLRHAGGFTLNPLDPRSLELVESLYDALLPCFRSQMLNVGCDETFDLGLGRSKAECERRGKERVYLDFILKIYDAVRRRGHTMQFWGDIILHKPELIGELPKDVIALNWGYEADHPFEKETRAFADAGVPFYVCPGTSSWVSISGRSDNAIGNLKSAAEWGLRNGAVGYLNTDWGDLGHLQYLPVSFLGFAAGAAYSWCYESNKDLDIAAALDVHVFRDAAGVMGRLMYDFGNIYQVVKNPVANGSRLFWSLMGEDRRRMWEPVTRADFDAADVGLDPIVSRLHDARMDRPDAQLIIDEVRNGAAMLKFACHHGRHRLGADRMSKSRMTWWLHEIVTEHKRLWLARNRPGGLRESCAQLEARRADYAQ